MKFEKALKAIRKGHKVSRASCDTCRYYYLKGGSIILKVGACEFDLAVTSSLLLAEDWYILENKLEKDN